MRHKKMQKRVVEFLAANSQKPVELLNNSYIYRAMDLTVKSKAIECLEEYIGEYRVRNPERFHKQDPRSTDHKGGGGNNSQSDYS